MERPSKGKNLIAKTRYEDFQTAHVLLGDQVHFVGHFLPWHRHLIALFYQAMRGECGYDGPGTFWDWTRDGDSSGPLPSNPYGILSSQIFDHATGFGGDGVAGTYSLPESATPETVYRPLTWKGCIDTGPFKNITIHIGPGKHITDHCIVRGIDFQKGFRYTLTTQSVNRAIRGRRFEDFRLSIDDMQNGIHIGPQFFIGGEMSDAWSSPGNPLFYLHHANLDRIWWKWQQADRRNRLYDISGPTTPEGSTTVTLDYLMDFKGLGRNFTIRGVMKYFRATDLFFIRIMASYNVIATW